jgi:hypothetical protein
LRAKQEMTGSHSKRSLQEERESHGWTENSYPFEGV